MERRTDLRRLSHKELTEFRHQAVGRVQAGTPVRVVCEGMGVSRAALFGWLALYRSGGWDALKAGKRGGRKPKLDGRQIEWLYETISNRDPRQLKFPFALWTLKMVGELIEREFGIKLSRWSISRLLRQLGLSPQRPLFRAWQQDAERVKRWKEEEYPALKRRAKVHGAVIAFLDESAVRSDHHAGTTWGKRGKTPVVRTTGARFSLNMVGAVTARGDFRFMTYAGTMNTEVFIRFLKRLLHDHDRPVYLVLDNHPVHKSKAVREFVESQEGRLELHFLPPYSPELNPVEQVWRHAKSHQVGKQVITGPDQLKRLAISALRRLQKLPNIIRSFFRHPECEYAL